MLAAEMQPLGGACRQLVLTGHREYSKIGGGGGPFLGRS